jgi:hypothetical protein
MKGNAFYEGFLTLGSAIVAMGAGWFLMCSDEDMVEKIESRDGEDGMRQMRVLMQRRLYWSYICI